MLTQNELDTENKKTTNHHNNKKSVLWMSATYLSLKKNNLMSTMTPKARSHKT
jgi:hypothetical protein